MVPEFAQWRKDRVVKLFISSNFLDMWEEREILAKLVFPALRVRCTGREVNFVPVDLNRSAHILKAHSLSALRASLKEIDNCRPWFLGLLGERYGWIPPEVDWELLEERPWLAEQIGTSITELEILHGTLNDPVKKGTCFFYMRDPTFLEQVTEAHRGDFVEDDAAAQARMRALKERIRRSGYYLRDNYPDPTTFGRVVLKDIWSAIDREFPELEEPEQPTARDLHRRIEDLFDEGASRRPRVAAPARAEPPAEQITFDPVLDDDLIVPVMDDLEIEETITDEEGDNLGETESAYATTGSRTQDLDEDLLLDETIEEDVLEEVEDDVTPEEPHQEALDVDSVEIDAGLLGLETRTAQPQESEDVDVDVVRMDVDDMGLDEEPPEFEPVTAADKSPGDEDARKTELRESDATLTGAIRTERPRPSAKTGISFGRSAGKSTAGELESTQNGSIEGPREETDAWPTTGDDVHKKSSRLEKEDSPGSTESPDTDQETESTDDLGLEEDVFLERPEPGNVPRPAASGPPRFSWVMASEVDRDVDLRFDMIEERVVASPATHPADGDADPRFDTILGESPKSAGPAEDAPAEPKQTFPPIVSGAILPSIKPKPEESSAPRAKESAPVESSRSLSEEVDRDVDLRLDAILRASPELEKSAHLYRAPVPVESSPIPEALSMAELMEKTRQSGIPTAPPEAPACADVPVCVRYSGRMMTVFAKGRSFPASEEGSVSIKEQGPRRYLEFFEGRRRVGAIPLPTAEELGKAGREINVKATHLGSELEVALWSPASSWKRTYRAPLTQRDMVDCTVFAPPETRVGNIFLVQAFLHLPSQTQQARSAAEAVDKAAGERGSRSLSTTIERGATVALHLRMPDLEVHDPVQEIVWNGEPVSAQFRVTVPEECDPRQVAAALTVSRQGVPIGKVEFVVEVVAEARQVDADLQPTGKARPFSLYFISYASRDRQEVLKRVQMLPLLGIGFRQDLFHFRPGTRWKEKIYEFIDESDAVLLFWSSNAKDSEWVTEECRYAIAGKGIDSIIPVLIEGPPPVEPPPELRDLHFNDPILYFLDTRVPAQPASTPAHEKSGRG